MRNVSLVKYSVIVLLCFFTSVRAFSTVCAHVLRQQVKTTNLELFQIDDPMEASIDFDIESFKKNKEFLREEGLAGVLTLKGGEAINVEVLSRGAGSMDNDMPPFKVKFKKKNVKGTIFKGLKKTKVAIPTDFNDPRFNQIMLSQYLTYRLFEEYTDYAFKTRLVRLSFSDEGSASLPTSWVILLEPNNDLAKRIGAEHVSFKYGEDFDINELRAAMDLNQAHKVIAFNFFAGNFDSSIPGLKTDMKDYFGPEQVLAPSEKNIKMFRRADGSFVPVAYDFDLSGTLDWGAPFWSVGYNAFKADGVEMPTGRVKYGDALTSLQKAYKEHPHKNILLDHRDAFVETYENWAAKYAEQIADLSENYLSDFQTYIRAVRALE